MASTPASIALNRFVPRSARRAVLLLALSLAATTLARPIPAVPFNVDLGDANFGHIKQGDTDFPNGGCGPTATANSFRYLQNVYYGPMGQTFVPGTGNANLVGIANTLAASMGTDDTKGTSVANLVKGKRDYARDHPPTTPRSGPPPDSFYYDADLDLTFRLVAGGAFALTAVQLDPLDLFRGPGSPEIKPNTSPSLGLLMQLVQRRYDIELLWRSPTEELGHWVTVVGLEVHADPDFPGTYEGSIRYIDPKTGALTKSAVTADSLTTGPLSVEYDGGTREVTGVAAEVPAPASALLFLFAAGIGTATPRRRR